jgi:hypothetical protein
MNPTLSASLSALLAREMRSGERLLWSGQPDARRAMLKPFAFYLFAVPWTAFSLSWETIAVRMAFTGAPPLVGIIMTLFGLPFVVIGLAMMAAPFSANRTARRTIYGVTDHRLVELISGRTLKVRSVEASSIGPVTRRQRENGHGTLSIETGSHRDSEGDRTTDTFVFESISEVSRVETLVNRLRQTAAAA